MYVHTAFSGKGQRCSLRNFGSSSNETATSSEDANGGVIGYTAIATRKLSKVHTLDSYEIVIGDITVWRKNSHPVHTLNSHAWFFRA